MTEHPTSEHPVIGDTVVEHLTDDLVRVVAGRANAYLWRGPDGITAVDSGEHGQEQRIRDALTELGARPTDIARIVLTHWHLDHSGGAADLAATGTARSGGEGGVEVCVGAADADVVRGLEPGPAPDLLDAERDLYEQVGAGILPAPPCVVHRELHDGDLLVPDDPAAPVVVATPGHTAGSIAVHFPRDGIVLTGDIASRATGDEVTLGPFNVDRAAAERSLRRLAALGPRAAGFGHGPGLHQHAAAALAAAPDPFTPAGGHP